MWDWASGIPEMLSSGDNLYQDNLYLVGHDTLGQSANGEWDYYLPDALGSIRQTTDDAGAVSGSREWTPFGVEVGVARGGLGYTGEWLDSYTEFNYLRARWYAPQMGRFLRCDPIESEPPYQYVRGNPINGVDPSGYIVFPWDVGTRQFYSCKCGWIDTAHASPKEKLINSVRNIRNSPHEWDFYQKTGGGGARTVYGNFMIRRQGVMGNDANTVALGIMVAWENFWERSQGYDIHQVTQSSFSEEDLVSDLIGFHRGLRQIEFGDTSTTRRKSFRSLTPPNVSIKWSAKQ